MLRVIGCITQQHDLRLVFLAACICALACATTLSLLTRVQSIRTPSCWKWLAAAAIVFGCGIWSLHFVAMLAFMPGMPIAYDISITIASAIVACVGAFLAFLSWRLSRSQRVGIAAGGVLLGLTIGAMHYSGVAAIELPGRLSLAWTGVFASFAASIAFAVVALARSQSLVLRWRRVEVSGWLALAICGHHFTAMAAISIDLGQPTIRAGAVLGSGALAITVGSVSLALLVVSLMATLMEQHLSQRTVLELKRLQLLSDISQETLIIHRAGVILQVNAAGGRLFGVATGELIGRDVLSLISDADRPSVMRRASCSAADLKPEEVQVQTVTGELIPVELSCSPLDYEGKPATALALRDMSDRRRDEAQIRHLAHHDALTNLPNRFLLQERLNHALDIAGRLKSKIALLYLDLDRFKLVNDLLGHAGGDVLLIQVAKRILAELRSTDTVARVGGDEFVIVTAVDQPNHIATLAGRLIETLARSFDIEGHQIEIGASAGIALYPEDGGNQEALMRAADTALYRAKDEKRGTFRFFEPAMNNQLQERRQLEQDLRHAIDRNELQLHYQPLVNCGTGEVDGFEALLRWNHPQRGMIPPMEFIPLAEETGLIVDIGQWALEMACHAAAKWDEPRRIAVNVSPVQFRQSDLLQVVSTTLARTGLAASRLEIEITEGILIEDSARAIAILSSLRKEGVRIALDDFGTGYSSLSYLRSFAFDHLKIDKSFIKELGQSKNAEMIVRTIIGLAHNLGLSVIAEGVETIEQLALVRDLTCDQVQGYLLGRPLEMGAFTELAAARARMLLGTSCPTTDTARFGVPL